MESGCKRASRECSTRAGKSYASANLVIGITFASHLGLLTDIFLNSMISYPNYKFIFPIKALGMFARRFDNSKVEN